MGKIGYLVLFTAALAGAVQADEDASRRELHLYLQGRYLYQKHCTECHGERGRGDGPMAEGLRDQPRDFRSGLFKLRSTRYGTQPTDDDLRRTIRSGISGTAMPIFAHLPDGDIDALVVYVKSLSRRWRDEECVADPIELPDLPGWMSEPAAAAEHVARGRAIFEATCTACHGETGAGDGLGAAALVDAAGRPVFPADLRGPHFKSGDGPADLYRAIATGFNGTPMVGFAETLAPEQVWDLVAFVRSLRKES